MTERIPRQVTVIVYSAHGLVPIKKDKSYFSVIFGIGQSKFKTDIVYDYHGNPSFNTESNIEAGDGTEPLLFLICCKHEKDVLGQVIVPFAEIRSCRTNNIIKRPLEPHKKSKNPSGAINFEVWVSEFYPVGVPAIVVTQSPLSLRKFKNLIVPNLKRNHSDNRGNKFNNFLTPTLTMKASMSCTDLSQFNATTSTNDSILDNTLPEINGISPNKSPTTGNTLITIRGNNLGISKEDVVGLFVCGANLLSTLQYISSNKLLCTTKPWKPMVGPINIETQSGGKTTSIIQFMFVDEVSATLKRTESLKNETQPTFKSFVNDFQPGLDLDRVSDPHKLGVISKLKSRSSLELNMSFSDNDHTNVKDSIAKNTESPRTKVSGPPIVQIYPIQNHSSKKDSVKPKIQKMKDLEEDLIKSKDHIAQLILEKSNLEEDNLKLREYLQKIVTKAIILCPNILESV